MLYRNIWDLKPRQIEMLNLKVGEVLRESLDDSRYEVPFTSRENLDATQSMLRYLNRKVRLDKWGVKIEMARVNNRLGTCGFFVFISKHLVALTPRVEVGATELQVALALAIAYANGHKVNWEDKRG